MSLLEWRTRARRGFAERVEIMVNATKLTRVQQDEINNKLINAVKNRDIRNALKLIENGADVNVKSNSGWTALHDAAWYGYVDVAKVLIENGADVDAKDKNSVTALHDAACYGHVDVAKVLIEKGADVDAKDKDGKTALHKAA